MNGIMTTDLYRDNDQHNIAKYFKRSQWMMDSWSMDLMSEAMVLSYPERCKERQQIDGGKASNKITVILTVLL